MTEQTTTPFRTRDNRTVRYVGYWHGGVNYGPFERDDAEKFATIADAASVLLSRARHNGFRQTFDYVSHGVESTFTPCADEGATLVLFKVDGTREDAERAMDDYERDGLCFADATLHIGPRGGVQRDAY